MASQRLILILLFLFFVFITHDGSTENDDSNNRYRQQPAHGTFHNGQDLAKANATLEILDSLSYGSFNPVAGKWLNLTGFQAHGSIPWARFSGVKERARERVRHVLGEDWRGDNDDGDGGDSVGDDEVIGSVKPFYKNVTGVVVGGWRSVDGMNNEYVMGNSTTWSGALFDRRYDRNITAHDGRLKIQLTQEEDPKETDKGM